MLYGGYTLDILSMYHILEFYAIELWVLIWRNYENFQTSEEHDPDHVKGFYNKPLFQKVNLMSLLY